MERSRPGTKAFIGAVRERLLAQLRDGARSAIVAVEDLVAWVVTGEEDGAALFPWSIVGAAYKSEADAPRTAAEACQQAAEALNLALVTAGSAVAPAPHVKRAPPRRTTKTRSNAA